MKEKQLFKIRNENGNNFTLELYVQIELHKLFLVGVHGEKIIINSSIILTTIPYFSVSLAVVGACASRCWVVTVTNEEGRMED